MGSPWSQSADETKARVEGRPWRKPPSGWAGSRRRRLKLWSTRCSSTISRSKASTRPSTCADRRPSSADPAESEHTLKRLQWVVERRASRSHLIASGHSSSPWARCGHWRSRLRGCFCASGVAGYPTGGPPMLRSWLPGRPAVVPGAILASYALLVWFFGRLFHVGAMIDQSPLPAEIATLIWVPLFLSPLLLLAPARLFWDTPRRHISGRPLGGPGHRVDRLGRGARRSRDAPLLVRVQARGPVHAAHRRRGLPADRRSGRGHRQLVDWSGPRPDGRFGRQPPARARPPAITGAAFPPQSLKPPLR